MNSIQRISVICSLLLVALTPTFLRSEGTKQLSPTANDLALLHINDASNAANNFAFYGTSNTAKGLCFIVRQVGEKVYFALSNEVKGSDGTDATAPGFSFRIVTMAGTVVHGPFAVTSSTSNGNVHSQVINGPNIGGNTIGYDVSNGMYVFTPTAVGTYCLEFDQTTFSNNQTSGAYLRYFDVSVANAGNQIQNGRLYSKNWGIRTPCSTSFGCNIPADQTFGKSFEGKLYILTDDNYVESISFAGSGFRGLSFQLAFNGRGPSNSGNAITDRRSLNASTSVNPQFKVFVNDPDPLAYNAPIIGEVIGNPTILNSSPNCSVNPNLCVDITLGEPGLIEVLLDFNGNDEMFTPNTTDRVLAKRISSPDSLHTCIPWDGKNGLGVNVNLENPVPILITFFQGEVHFMMSDVEYNNPGYTVALEHPSNGNFQSKHYWDDTNIDASNDDDANLDADNNATTQPPGLPPNPPFVEISGKPQPAHIWNRNTNSSTLGYGEGNVINTWWFGHASVDGPLSITPCPAPEPDTITVSPSCFLCSVPNICPTADDINIDGTTTFSSCTQTPSGQGTLNGPNGSGCYEWVQNGNQTSTIFTCVIACTNSVCDTTFVIILPPPPPVCSTFVTPLALCNYVTSNPNSSLALADCDNGGINNLTECQTGEDPFDPSDDCESGDESNTNICLYVTSNPNSSLALADCDNGGINNLTECQTGEDPFDPSDDCESAEENGTNICSYVQSNPTSSLATADCDNGGVNNLIECEEGGDPFDPDDECESANNPGFDICDYVAINQTGDLAQADCDEGGVNNLQECEDGGDPFDPTDDCESIDTSVFDICEFIELNPNSTLALGDCDGGGVSNSDECQTGDDPLNPNDDPSPIEDINITYVNVPVSGDVSTNDINVPIGSIYLSPPSNPSNPDEISIPVINPDGTYTFVSPIPGIYTFYVPIILPSGDTITSVLKITVLDSTSPYNQPVANIDIATTLIDTPVTLNTLANDYSGNQGVDLDSTSVNVVIPPNNGTYTINPINGNITYTPNPGFTGMDTLIYIVSDDNGNIAKAMQIITILPLGVANTTTAADDYVSTPFNTPVDGNLLNNDSDAEGDEQTIVPQNITVPEGILVLNSDGTYTFTPTNGFSGPVEFPYTVYDDNPSGSDTAYATLHILVEPNPCAITFNDASQLCLLIANNPNHPLANLDCDGGGISNEIECELGGDPLDPDDECESADTSAFDLCLYISNNPLSDLATADCDEGGVPNNIECENGEDPLDPSDDCESADTSVFNICNYVLNNPTSTLALADCDNGGVSNFDECDNNGDPFDPSDDCESIDTTTFDICDYVINNTTSTLALGDCDGGGVSNLLECEQDGDPFDPDDECMSADTFVFDLCDYITNNPGSTLALADCDNGGVPNYIECEEGGDPFDPEDECESATSTSFDICTYIENNPGGDLANADCDEGGVPNYIECESGEDPFDPNDDCESADTSAFDICTYVENNSGSSLALADCDAGGVSNLDECEEGGDPFDNTDDCGNIDPSTFDLCLFLASNPSSPLAILDCDAGGVINQLECEQGGDPFDPNDDCNSADTSIFNICNYIASNPTSLLATADCDFGGVPNNIECDNFGDPFDQTDDCESADDPDFDLCSYTLLYPTSPMDLADCDEGGVPNGIECLQGGDPLDPSDDCESADTTAFNICNYIASNPTSLLAIADCDNGGVPNGIECENGGDPLDEDDDCNSADDTDFDLCDYVLANSTSILALADCDNGGVPNGIECENSGDPLDPTDDCDSADDADFDLCDYVLANSTSILALADCDNGGVPNGIECENSGDPFDPTDDCDSADDADFDLCDYVLANSTSILSLADCDNGGVPNGIECENGGDPLDPTDDCDSADDADFDLCNYVLANPTSILSLADCDNGGVPNGIECENGGDPLDPTDDCDSADGADFDLCDYVLANPASILATSDCDNGGVNNLLECLQGGNPLNGLDDCNSADTSAFDICNYVESNPTSLLATYDCDNGGVNNLLECLQNGNPFNASDDCNSADTSVFDICTYVENNPTSLLATSDCDNGGVNNLLECLQNGNPFNAADDCNSADTLAFDICTYVENNPTSLLATSDCDNGGVPNLIECENGGDPFDPTDDCDSADDPDYDICLYVESNPNSSLALADCDNGGVPNLIECENDGDPLNEDDDCDSADDPDYDICLYVENNPNSTLALADCDNGGITNIVECENDGDPLDPEDDCESAEATNFDICDYLDTNPSSLLATADCDDGGVPNDIECTNGDDPYDPSDDNSTNAVNDINQTPINTSVSGDVHTNDNDAEGDGFTVTAFIVDTNGDGIPDAPAAIGTPVMVSGVNEMGNPVLNAGTLTLNSDGSYTLEPALNFVGTITTNYANTDDNLLNPATDTASLVIEVKTNNVGGNDNPIANDDNNTTEQGVPVNNNVLPNDSDPDGDPLIVSSLLMDTDGDGNTDDAVAVGTSTPIYGTNTNGDYVAAGFLVINGDGSYTYTPNGTFIGTITSVYTIIDGEGGSDDAVLTIDVIPNNGNNTFANDDANSGLSGELQTGNILDNDNDPEGHTQIATSITGSNGNSALAGNTLILPSGGTLVVNSNGTYTYNPFIDFVGTEIVTYTISDGNGALDTATIYLTTFMQPTCADALANPFDICEFLEDHPLSPLANADCDNGGLSNILECGQGGNPLDSLDECISADTSAFNICNYISLNPNSYLANADCDLGGVPNGIECENSGDPFDPTDDCDSAEDADYNLCQYLTANPNSILAAADCDLGGVPNGIECENGGNPLDPTDDCESADDAGFDICVYVTSNSTSLLALADCDNGGVPNGIECENGGDPLDPTDDCDSADDADYNLCQYLTANPSSIIAAADCDLGGVPNGIECENGGDPLDPTDDCESADDADFNICVYVTSNPTSLLALADCDLGGVPNGIECENGGDPLDPTDDCESADDSDYNLCQYVTANPSSTLAAADCDLGGVPNGIECENGGDPLDPTDDCESADDADYNLCQYVTTNPSSILATADCDLGGVPNGIECENGGDPLDPTDDCESADDADFNICVYITSNPTSLLALADCDNGGVPNGIECDNGGDPLDPTDDCESADDADFNICVYVTSNSTSLLALADCDNGGVPNGIECENGGDPLDPTDDCESADDADYNLCQYVTANPTSLLALADCDNGGVPNLIECENGGDPLDSTDDCDSADDADFNFCQYVLTNTNSLLALADCDNGGINNLTECQTGENPFNPADDCTSASQSGTNICPYVTANPASLLALADCDNGGVPNGIECGNNGNPFNAADDCNSANRPGFNICNYVQANPTSLLALADCDNGGINNLTECQTGENPFNPADDCTSASQSGTNICPYVQANPTSLLALADCDNGGVPNGIECGNNGNPFNASDDCNSANRPGFNICNYVQANLTSLLALADCDNGGINNLTECQTGENPFNPADDCTSASQSGTNICPYVQANPTSLLALSDCDNGGVPNGIECGNGGNPFNASDDCNSANRPGFNICTYVQTNPTSLLALADCDNGGINNLTECQTGENPFNPSDDCTSASQSGTNICPYVQTNPTSLLALADCDNGGVPNGIECGNGGNPFNASDDCNSANRPGFNICTYVQSNPTSLLALADCDNGGINNLTECQTGENPFNPADDCTSADESNTNICPFVLANPTSTFALADCDNGGVSNVVECRDGGDPFDATDDLGTVGNFVWEDLDGDGIQDAGEPGIMGVQVSIYDLSNNLIATTGTDASGNYSLTARPGQYYLSFTPPIEYQFTLPNTGSDNTDSEVDGTFGFGTTSSFVISGGQPNNTMDAGIHRCVSIGEMVFYDIDKDDVKDNNENGINGLVVKLYRRVNNVWSVYATTYTGHKPGTPSDDGYWKFCAPPGTYYVQMTIPPLGLVPVKKDKLGFVALTNINEQANDSDIDFSGKTDIFTVTSGQSVNKIGGGFYPMATAGNLVWEDTNSNGVQEQNEPKAANVLVEAFNMSNQKIGEDITDNSGVYKIEYLGKDDYYLKFTPPSGYGFTSANEGTEQTDSDVDHSHGTNTTSVFSMEPGINYINIDAGLAFGVLPVTWLSIDAKYLGDYIEVSWSTATELNTDIFEVERLDIQGNFIKIGTVKAAGNSSTKKSYSFNDTDVYEGNTYQYRIRQIDFDGRYTYSDKVSVYVPIDRKDIVLYPVPASEKAFLQVTLKEESDVKVSMIDIKGTEILSSILNQKLSDGIHHINIGLENIPSGVYTVLVSVNGIETKKRLIVIE